LFDGLSPHRGRPGFSKFIKAEKHQYRGVAALEVSEEEIIKAACLTGEITSGRTDDTNEAIIKDRIAEYNKKNLCSCQTIMIT